jgi:hypothetical protein
LCIHFIPDVNECNSSTFVPDTIEWGKTVVRSGKSINVWNTVMDDMDTPVESSEESNSVLSNINFKTTKTGLFQI